ncbi:MAG: hypothetical protein SYNGOMJ08_00050 [Candidatus Syntrophoarchaeum sp. GoM_oil]|nr:MAG: hypothetical protein SYNGOMJ08_00050 [Candidatus Syntrophoarchaeum sp. GoM_oil]
MINKPTIPKKQYVTNESGNRIAVLPDIETFQQLKWFMNCMDGRKVDKYKRL